MLAFTVVELHHALRLVEYDHLPLIGADRQLLVLARPGAEGGVHCD